MIKKTILSYSIAISLLASFGINAMPSEQAKLLKNVESKVIEWRRDFHKHPELSNRETRTAGIVAKHLKNLGMEVETDIAYTGGLSQF